MSCWFVAAMTENVGLVGCFKMMKRCGIKMPCLSSLGNSLDSPLKCNSRSECGFRVRECMQLVALARLGFLRMSSWLW